MGQKRRARTRTSGSKARSLAPKKLGVRQQDAVRGGWSWGMSQSGTTNVVTRPTPREGSATIS
jgi:hypothetical protein